MRWGSGAAMSQDPAPSLNSSERFDLGSLRYFDRPRCFFLIGFFGIYFMNYNYLLFRYRLCETVLFCMSVSPCGTGNSMFKRKVKNERTHMEVERSWGSARMPNLATEAVCEGCNWNHRSWPTPNRGRHGSYDGTPLVRYRMGRIGVYREDTSCRRDSLAYYFRLRSLHPLAIPIPGDLIS